MAWDGWLGRGTGCPTDDLDFPLVALQPALLLVYLGNIVGNIRNIFYKSLFHDFEAA
jgi:hypothetical protein